MTFTERVRINAELAELHGHLHSQDDATTQKLIKWYTDLATALRTNGPLQPIIDEYKVKSRDLLQDAAVDTLKLESTHPMRHLLDILLDPKSILHTDEIQRAFGHLA